MVIVPNLQDLSAGSGIINVAFLESVYHSFMDDAMSSLGGNRGQVIFHLKPLIQQDNITQGKAAPQQYNPFFGRVPVPNTNTRNPGTKITTRDVEYSAQIVIGPLKPADDNKGIGFLKDNEAMITVVIEALQHVEEALSVSIEGRRYVVQTTRPIGFSVRRYLMVKLVEVQELENPSPDVTIG